ncbi:hypothetical protein BDW22DRAFT_1363531 [Trametopsis cervina]|nr:hypothetical protein BDW22DRAFT_1363531 [Trametopsis cervina]
MLSRRVMRLPAGSRVVARAPQAVGVRFMSNASRHEQVGRSAKGSPLDSANSQSGKQASRGGLLGNPEGVGFADQVGSQSSSIHGGEIGKQESAEGHKGEENITPPSFTDAVKSKLGFKTTAGEDKQNRGGGKGVTGTGKVTADSGKRTMHTSAVAYMPAKTQGQAPEGSRKPKESTHADQNSHLKHKSSTGTPDHGKGNAAKNPKLPSHEVAGSSGKSNSTKRAFHTSALRSENAKHTADSYFKDIDDAKPVNPKVHQVDSSSDTGAPVARANEHPATGPFSRSGSGSSEYESTQSSKGEQPYNKPSPGDSDQDLRYGGQPGLSKPSKSNEGPSGKAAGGRKAEGR